MDNATDITVSRLQTKQHQRLAEHVREAVQQDQPVSEYRHRDALKMAKLHWNLLW